MDGLGNGIQGKLITDEFVEQAAERSTMKFNSLLAISRTAAMVREGAKKNPELLKPIKAPRYTLGSGLEEKAGLPVVSANGFCL